MLATHWSKLVFIHFVVFTLSLWHWLTCVGHLYSAVHKKFTVMLEVNFEQYQLSEFAPLEFRMGPETRGSRSPNSTPTVTLELVEHHGIVQTEHNRASQRNGVDSSSGFGNIRRGWYWFRWHWGVWWMRPASSGRDVYVRFVRVTFFELVERMRERDSSFPVRNKWSFMFPQQEGEIMITAQVVGVIVIHTHKL